jgi:hypothetical protein
MASGPPALSTRAQVVADFLDNYGNIWTRHFPNCRRRAYWHIAHLLKFESTSSGLFFSKVQGRLTEVYGLNYVTSASRVFDFYTANFLEPLPDSLSTSTRLVATEHFHRVFDKHYHETANYLLHSAAALGLTSVADRADVITPEMLLTINTVFSQIGKLWIDELQNFLLENMTSESDKARLNAQYSLLSLSHWLIFIVLWLNFSNNTDNPALRLNKILQEVYRRELENDASTIKKHLNDMIKWGFLVRGGRSTFAMEEEAFSRFQNVFAQGATVIADAAQLITSQQPDGVVILRSRPA